MEVAQVGRASQFQRKEGNGILALGGTTTLILWLLCVQLVFLITL